MLDVEALFPGKKERDRKARFQLGARHRPHESSGNTCNTDAAVYCGSCGSCEGGEASAGQDGREQRIEGFHVDTARYGLRVCLRLCEAVSRLYLMCVSCPGAALFTYELPPNQVRPATGMVWYQLALRAHALCTLCTLLS